MGEGGGVAVLVILYSVQRGGAGCYSGVGGATSKTTPGLLGNCEWFYGGVRRSLHLSVHDARFRTLEV